MGQAKQRGTFADRQQAAYERIDAGTAKLRENVVELERLERESEAMSQTNGLKFVQVYWQYSDIEQRVLPYMPELVLTGMPEMVIPVLDTTE
jgi:hypothetical protein